MNHLRDLAAQGYSIHSIAEQTGIARNTVRKYLRSTGNEPVAPVPRKKRKTKLDSFKDQIQCWVEEDHLYNCQTILERIRAMGYKGSGTMLRVFMQPLRPARQRRAPVIRYETAPGAQLQLDWGEFLFEENGAHRKLYGLVAVLGYSRMRFVVFFKRCDTASLIKGLMEAFEYYEGVPQVVLTDRMKSVLLSVEDGKPQWNSRFSDFAASLGFVPRVCRAYTPQTKGKVERTVSLVKTSFWAGVRFSDLEDLNRQALHWCQQRNERLHQTTHCRPVDRLVEEKLSPLPEGYAFERYRCEERKVTWDGYVSYDGVLYGVPGALKLAGKVLLVSAHRGKVRLYAGGICVAQHEQQTQSGRAVMHPEQFTDVATANEQKRLPVPLAHQAAIAPLVQRPLSEYDNVFGLVGGGQEVAA